MLGHFIAFVAASLALAGPPDLSLDRGRGLADVPPSVLHEGDPFRQLDEVLPTPGDFRTASGAPGARYWQQKVDHAIEVTLDPAKAELSGRQRVTYHNNSPDELRYIWMQLDQNRFRRDSMGERAEPAPDLAGIADAVRWQDFVAGQPTTPAYEPLPFDHPTNTTINTKKT